MAEQDKAKEKVTYTRKQRKAFRANRQKWAQLPNVNFDGSSGSGSSGSSGSETGFSSYGIAAAGGDMTDPNSYVQAPAPIPETMPEWARPAKPAHSDPSFANPLPTGKSLLTMNPFSPEFKARQQRAQETLADPAAFMDENVVELTKDQTIIDKGFGFIEGLFNYEDESDLQIFGMNISAVESVWDMGMRYMTGAYNLKDIGMGALISAMPGGVQTMTFNELTGGQGYEGGLSIGEVLHGDMGLKGNVAPSPGQIAIASIAIESKRIREGGARMSDVLLANPVIAPFILAGIAAETSPLQKDGFNILDPVQRESAFSQGYEQWMSGLTDFGNAFADPAIVAGLGLKAARLGLLGSASGRKGALLHEAMAEPTYNNIETALAAKTPGYVASTWASREADAIAGGQRMAARKNANAMQRQEAFDLYEIPMNPDKGVGFWDKMTELGIVENADEAFDLYTRGSKSRVDNMGVDPTTLPESLQDEMRFADRMDQSFETWHRDQVDVASRDAGDLPPPRETNYVTMTPDELGLKSPLERLVIDAVRVVDDKGTKAMPVAKILKRKEFRRNGWGPVQAQLLSQIYDPYVALLTINTWAGSNKARRLLEQLRPALADDIFNIHAKMVAARSLMEPAQFTAAMEALDKSRDALQLQLNNALIEIAKEERKFAADAAKLRKQAKVLDETASEPQALRPKVDADGNPVLDPDGKPVMEMSHDVVRDPFLAQRKANLEQSLSELEALRRQMNGTPVDQLAPGDWFDVGKLIRQREDLYNNADTLDMALQRELHDTQIAVDRDARIIIKDNMYSRMVAKSRERSAAAGYSYMMEGSGLIPRRVPKVLKENELNTPTEFETRWEWGWVAGSQYGVGRVRRAARVWRWAGQYTPNGILGLKGPAIQGSDQEITAVTNLRLYKGKQIEVTKADGSVVYVGGQVRRAQLIDMWTKAMLDPLADLKTTAVRIERAMEEDFALAYGVPEEQMRAAMAKADKVREQSLESVKKVGYFVDPDTRQMEHVPYLKQHLANSHLMHNWNDLEHNLQRVMLDAHGPKAGSLQRKAAHAGDISVTTMKQIDEAFQSMWRPLVLFRMSYTQRNVFEGMSRAMAYYGSLAPMLWPVTATFHGLDNAMRNSVVKHAQSKFVKKVSDDATFKAAQHELGQAVDEHQTIAGATLPWLPDDDEWKELLATDLLDPTTPRPTEPARFVQKRIDGVDRVVKILTPDEWLDEMKRTSLRQAEARLQMESVETVLDAAAGNSRFGKWRKKNIDGLKDELCDALARRNNLSSMTNTASVLMASSQGADLINATHDVAIAQRALDTLRYDPVGALQLWKGQAGRKKRIGSGSSKGPYGGTYIDAFADAYEGMNRGAMSSDIARKMTLSSGSNRTHNIFMDEEVMENTPIPWNESDPEAWLNGMAQSIETAAWNPMLEVLLRNDFSADAAVEWMLFTDEGRKHAAQVLFLSGEDWETPSLRRSIPSANPGKTVYDRKAYEDWQKRTNPNAPWQDSETRLKKQSERMRDPLTGQYYIIDHVDAVMGYAHSVATDLRNQLQGGLPQLVKLQMDRAMAVKLGSPTVITPSDIANAIDTMTPEQKGNLGFIMGSTAIQSGHRNLVRKWRALVDNLFRVIGTIPEDAVVRGPFYNKRFKQVRNDLIVNYFEQQPGGVPKGVKYTRTTKSGKVIEDDLTTPQMQMPVSEWEHIIEVAHRQALYDTREYLYTIERRTNLGKYGEYIWPFISAQQNTITAGGKLLWRNPWVAPVMYDLWSAPQRLGYKDDEGNLTMVMPLEWVSSFLEDKVDIPVIGGILSGDAMMTFPSNGFNVWAPDTGFGGIIPRPGPLFQMTASNLMQVGLFPVDTPEPFKAFLGEEGGTALYGLIKNYMFGEDGSMSTKPGSYDVLLPAYVRRFLESRDETSEAYAYHFQLEWAHQMVRAINGEREWPSSAEAKAEINKRVTNKVWFYLFGNFGVPTPLTPYPILTRPDIKNPTASLMQEILALYMEAQGKKNPDGTPMIEPGQALLAFERDFGEDLLPLSMSSTTKSIAGAESTENTLRDIKAYDSIIRDIAGGLGENTGVLDILINNSNGVALDYSDEAFRYQKVALVPGINEEWRRTMSGDETVSKRMVDAGWTDFRRWMDQAESQMSAAGVKNWSVKAAEPWVKAKKVWLINRAQSNPDWHTDYMAGASKRMPATMKLMSRMANDPIVMEHMLQNGQEMLWASIRDYVFYRQQTVAALEATDDPYAKEQIKEAWNAIRFELQDQDMRFSEISARWLDTDDNPTFLGDDLVTSPAEEMVASG